MQKDYKDTLNLPRTDFPMKANLTQREPEMLRFWEDEKIYDKVQWKNRDQKHYILHDGPPYANGNIHIGHALNKILKDIIVKFKSMKGFYAPYVPGWDCHGLPIELQVDKNLGDKKEKIDLLEKRRLCREYAGKFVDIQRNEFKRLGVFGDWDRPYLTMSYEYEASIVREFNRFLKSGSVYKGKKPVHWCPSCVTALAEAEVEYAEKESPSVYVKFRISEADASSRLNLAGKEVYIVIWTTTPWTLPANLALAVKGDINYAAVLMPEQKELLIVACDLIGKLHSQGILPADNVYRIFPGSSLNGLKADHPFIDRKSVIVEADFVSTEEGSGIVHIAPGHGEDDYETGLKYGLDIYAPVDEHGKFTRQAEGLEGQFVFKANARIIEILKARNALIKDEKVVHSYPHCWRCKKPVIFRATEQWFISMEKNELRTKALEGIGNVTWVPAWGRDRIYSMVMNRPDWCISRQRSWGVPITAVRCGNCGSFADDNETLDNIEGLVREQGADVWFSRKADEFLPAGYSCRKCSGSSFVKEMDILDVWFDSGVSHAAVLGIDSRLSLPADMYLEGSDQHRGWFQSSLLTSISTKATPPYKTVLTHGFVVDGSGKKMSKSLGNVVSPQEIIKANGAEILRLWVSAEDYRDDIRISKEIIDRLTEAYRKIRNTARFLLSNLSDFDGRDYSGSLAEIDRWAMSRLQGLVARITDAYERFNFHEVYHSLHNFCVVDMSSFYLDILKDRLYTSAPDSHERRAAQWVLHQVLSVMVRLMSPILSFNSEEIWKAIKGETAESVFLSSFPEAEKKYMDKALEDKWGRLIEIRNIANKSLEVAREKKLIGNSLEAKASLFISNEKDFELLAGYKDFLPFLFIVSQVELMKSDGTIPVDVGIDKAQGKKCGRCWNWSESVGQHSEAPEICHRCYDVINR